MGSAYKHIDWPFGGSGFTSSPDRHGASWMDDVYIRIIDVSWKLECWMLYTSRGALCEEI